MLPAVSRAGLKKHVEDIHKRGLLFNYLLNAACLGNAEFTPGGRRQIRSLLDWLVQIKADSVTVAVPYLAQLIKKHYPRLRLYVSSFANINSLPKALFWQDMGADLIVLEPTSVNRDFDTLRSIRKGIRCGLELVANNACLLNCPFNEYHQKINAHASRGHSALGHAAANFCSLNCKFLRLKDPVNFICSDWIRPEDAHYYEEAGIDSLKIAGRARGADFILKALGAYIDKGYKGNLADLFPFFYGNGAPVVSGEKKEMLGRALRYFPRLLGAGFLLNLKITRALSEFEVYIDNAALDGFLEFFVQGGCKKKADSRACGHCREFAKRAVRFPEGFSKDSLLSKYEELLNA